MSLHRAFAYFLAFGGGIDSLFIRVVDSWKIYGYPEIIFIIKILLQVFLCYFSDKFKKMRVKEEPKQETNSSDKSPINEECSSSSFDPKNQQKQFILQSEFEKMLEQLTKQNNEEENIENGNDEEEEEEDEEEDDGEEEEEEELKVGNIEKIKNK
ncbi:unnamed protein product [Meloidogyne enterolobii]|uniref:Uncharacterized protein n=1 Tax=Meloidogyne enterolobii TaxID=390850 RepID=A0ACB0Y1P1_MELEN